MSEAKEKKEEKKVKKGGVRIMPLLFMIVGLPFLMPTLLVCSGLIPTLVALVTDDDPDKSRAVCIGSLNFAGVFPFIVDLWTKGQEWGVAWAIVRNPHNWLIMLGAAGVGQLILFAIPPLVTSLNIMQNVSRLDRLKETVEQLKSIWGPDVATSRSLDEIRKQSGS